MNNYICHVCGKDFQRYPSTVRNPKTVCCSLDCSYIMKKTTGVGEYNNNWRGGRHENLCVCGNTKDYRAKKCAVCARVGYPKYGKQRDEMNKETIESLVRNSQSVLEISTLTNTSRQYVSKLIKKYNIDTSHFLPSGKAERYLDPNVILINGTRVWRATIKNCILRNNLLDYRCNICGINTWNDKSLQIELHHKNGNPADNRIENLQFLCPNCHSQTDTYKGKNCRGSRKVKHG